jgi:DNA-binding IclR family transcriptional regulator
MAKGTESTIRSVARALDVLSLFGLEHQARSLKDLSVQTGLARTTMLRILGELQHAGMIWSIGNHEYAVGPGLLRWASLADATFHLPVAVQSALARLAEESGETASIYVRSGLHRFCIAQEESNQALRHVAQIGLERPLWTGAVARVLISDLDDADLDEIARESPMGLTFSSTIAQWRSAVASDGFAATHNERRDGLSVVAVPIHGPKREVRAAMSIAGPTERFGPERVLVFRHSLLTAQAAIEGTPFITSIGPGSR